MDLHLIFLSDQVLSFSWGIFLWGISQEESPPMGQCGQAVSGFQEVTFPQYQAGQIPDWFVPHLCVGGELRAAKAEGWLWSLCYTNECVCAGVSCCATYKDRWMNMKALSTHACVCWHQQGVSCWLREQIFWQCHVCVLCCLVWNGACSCKRAAQQPSASLPQPHATRSLQEW